MHFLRDGWGWKRNWAGTDGDENEMSGTGRDG